ncbi:hypothetical protein SynBIOSE41_01688 [Synechococcus sp. BIOS-E4-1]|nr:hypothetical protein SynBIOSE41_01688 [Synechococcus sp. BIOS-E4-1]
MLKEDDDRHVFSFPIAHNQLDNNSCTFVGANCTHFTSELIYGYSSTKSTSARLSEDLQLNNTSKPMPKNK